MIRAGLVLTMLLAATAAPKPPSVVFLGEQPSPGEVAALGLASFGSMARQPLEQPRRSAD